MEPKNFLYTSKDSIFKFAQFASGSLDDVKVKVQPLNRSKVEMVSAKTMALSQPSVYAQ
jgi:hypothetical protein